MRNAQQELQGAQHHFSQRRPMSGAKKEQLKVRKDVKSERKEKAQSILNEGKPKGGLQVYSFKQRRGSDK